MRGSETASHYRPSAGSRGSHLHCLHWAAEDLLANNIGDEVHSNEPDTAFSRLRPEQQILVFFHLISWLRGEYPRLETAQAQALLMDAVLEGVFANVQIGADLEEEPESELSQEYRDHQAGLLRAAAAEIGMTAPQGRFSHDRKGWERMVRNFMWKVVLKRGKGHVRFVGLNEFLLLCVELEVGDFGAEMVVNYHETLNAMAAGPLSADAKKLLPVHLSFCKPRDLRAFREDTTPVREIRERMCHGLPEDPFPKLG